MKLILEEKDVNIEVENPGILEVPKDKKVYDLPVSHFKKLIDKKGRKKIIQAISNLQIWNKNDDPKIASWAKKMKKSLEGYGEKKTKNESLKESSKEVTPKMQGDINNARSEIITELERRVGNGYYEDINKSITSLNEILNDLVYDAEIDFRIPGWCVKDVDNVTDREALRFFKNYVNQGNYITKEFKKLLDHRANESLKESNEEINKRIYTIKMEDGRKFYTDRYNIINYYDHYDPTPYKNMIWVTKDLNNIVDGKLKYGFTVFTSEIAKIPPRSQVESDDQYGDESPQNYDVDEENESLKESSKEPFFPSDWLDDIVEDIVDEQLADGIEEELSFKTVSKRLKQEEVPTYRHEEAYHKYQNCLVDTLEDMKESLTESSLSDEIERQVRAANKATSLEDFIGRPLKEFLRTVDHRDRISLEYGNPKDSTHGLSGRVHDVPWNAADDIITEIKKGDGKYYDWVINTK